MERQPHNPEASSVERQTAVELEKLAGSTERREQMPESREQQQERVELAREELEQFEDLPAPKEHESEPRGSFISGFDRATAYKETMTALRSRLTPAQRRFSDVIHKPAIEKISNFAGKTVMRPSVTLGATLTAAVVGGLLYMTARNVGFRLNGSEIMISLLIGGIAGAFVELAVKGLKLLFRRQK